MIDLFADLTFSVGRSKVERAAQLFEELLAQHGQLPSIIAAVVLSIFLFRIDWFLLFGGLKERHVHRGKNVSEYGTKTAHVCLLYLREITTACQ